MKSQSKIYTFSFRKMHLKMLSGKWLWFCLGLSVLRVTFFLSLQPQQQKSSPNTDAPQFERRPGSKHKLEPIPDNIRPYQRKVGYISQTIFPSKFKFYGNFVCSDLNSDIVITTKFCTWHDSCDMSCAKNFRDLIASKQKLLQYEFSVEFELW